MAVRPQLLRTVQKLAEAAKWMEGKSPDQIAAHVRELVAANRKWRGEECLNLLAPESLMSPGARSLLSEEISQRCAEGEIGDRWFSGTKFIDELEALVTELAKRVFRARFADHRLVSGMIANTVTYWALTRPGDTIMSVSEPLGGHVSNRRDGPPGYRGLRVVDCPFDPHELTVDLDTFRREVFRERPRVIALGCSLTLFPFPLREMRGIADEAGARIYFDGAHTMGLIAGGQFQDPLREGADVLTGSTGKTMSGPQGGLIVWNDEALTEPLRLAIFPGIAATHQVNRVAALGLALCELMAFGQQYAAQIVANARALAAGLEEEGIPCLGRHKGYTATHQVAADVTAWGGGLEAARRLEQANIICNKNLLPKDDVSWWENPSGLRFGTTEVTRLGMKEAEMKVVARLVARVLVHRESPEAVKMDVIELRRSFQHVQYHFGV